MKKDNFKWLEGTGEFYDKVNPVNLKSEFESISASLVANIEKYGKGRQVIDSGAMLSNSNIEIKKSDSAGRLLYEVFMVDYADYVNEGVKGWGSSKNAPNSPYQFKSKGMNEEGRKSIMASIQRGTMMLADTRYTKVKQGLERKFKEAKKKTVIEKQADRIIWNIKKYGIKTTDFLNDAVKDTFKYYDANIVKAYIADLTIRLTK